MNEDNEAVQRRVKATIVALMRYRGCTQVDLAAATGMGRSTLNAKVSGPTAVSLHDLFVFAAGLRVPADVLLLAPRDALLRVLADEVPS